MTATLERITRVHPHIAPERDDNAPPGYDPDPVQDQINFQTAMKIVQQRKQMETARAEILKRKMADFEKAERRKEVERNTRRNKIKKNRRGKRGN